MTHFQSLTAMMIRIVRPAIKHDEVVAPCADRKCGTEVRIQLYRTLHKTEHFEHVGTGVSPHHRQGTQEQVVAPHNFRGTRGRTTRIGLAHGRFYGCGGIERYPVLEGKNVVKRVLEPVSPDLGAGVGVNQLHDNPDSSSGLADAPFENITN